MRLKATRPQQKVKHFLDIIVNRKQPQKYKNLFENKKSTK